MSILSLIACIALFVCLLVLIFLGIYNSSMLAGYQPYRSLYGLIALIALILLIYETLFLIL